jgi:hypothetical protein
VTVNPSRTKKVIDCGEGAEQYFIIVEAADAKTIAEIESKPELRGLTGEELFLEMMANTAGKITRVTRLRDHFPADGPKGEAAIEEYKVARVYITHMRGGLKHDSIKGDPAFQIIQTKNFKRISSERYHKGERQDDPDGDCALREYHVTGSIKRLSHYKSGHRINGPDNSPADILFYPDGTLWEIQFVNDKGEIHTSPKGGPAIITFSRSGKISSARLFKNGAYIGGVGAQEQNRWMPSAEQIAEWKKQIYPKQNGDPPPKQVISKPPQP